MRIPLKCKMLVKEGVMQGAALVPDYLGRWWWHVREKRNRAAARKLLWKVVKY